MGQPVPPLEIKMAAYQTLGEVTYTYLHTEIGIATTTLLHHQCTTELQAMLLCYHVVGCDWRQCTLIYNIRGVLH